MRTVNIKQKLNCFTLALSNHDSVKLSQIFAVEIYIILYLFLLKTPRPGLQIGPNVLVSRRTTY